MQLADEVLKPKHFGVCHCFAWLGTRWQYCLNERGIKPKLSPSTSNLLRQGSIHYWALHEGKQWGTRNQRIQSGKVRKLDQLLSTLRSAEVEILPEFDLSSRAKLAQRITMRQWGHWSSVFILPIIKLGWLYLLSVTSEGPLNIRKRTNNVDCNESN